MGILIFSSSICLGWNEIAHVNLLVGLTEISFLPLLFQLMASPITQVSKLEISVIFKPSFLLNHPHKISHQAPFASTSGMFLKSGPSSLSHSHCPHALFQYPANWPWGQSSLPIQALPSCCCRREPSKKRCWWCHSPPLKLLMTSSCLRIKAIKPKDPHNHLPIPFLSLLLLLLLLLLFFAFLQYMKSLSQGSDPKRSQDLCLNPLCRARNWTCIPTLQRWHWSVPQWKPTHSISNLHLDSATTNFPLSYSSPTPTPPPLYPLHQQPMNAPWSTLGTGNGLSCLCPCTHPCQAEMMLWCLLYLAKPYLVFLITSSTKA